MNEKKINSTEANFSITFTAEAEIAEDVFVTLSGTFPIKLKDPTIKSLQEWREAFYWKYISNSTYVSSFGNNRNLGIKENASSVLFTKYTIRTGETTTKEVSTLWPKDYYQRLEAIFNEGALPILSYIPLLSNLITLRDGPSESSVQNVDLLGALWEDLDFSWYLDKPFSQYYISMYTPYKSIIGAEDWEEFVNMAQLAFSISTIWDIYKVFTMLMPLMIPMYREIYYNMSKAWPIQYKVGWFCTELLAGSVAPTYDMPIIPIGVLRSYVTKLLQLGRIKDEANLYSIVKVLGSENKMSYLMATYLYDMMYPSKIICTDTSTNRSREPYAQTKYGVLPAWDMSLIPEDMKDTYDADAPTCAYIIKLDYPSINSTELPKDMIVTTKIVNLITGETIADNPEDFWQSWLKHTKDVKSAL